MAIGNTTLMLLSINKQYKNMLIFRAFFNTQSDQNILQNATNCTIFSKFSQGS